MRISSRHMEWAGVLLLLGCLAVFADKQSLPVWPPPPAEPKIAYVRDISCPSDIGAKPAAFGRLFNWITGAPKDKQRLEKPFGLALDETGNLLVTDTAANGAGFLDLTHKNWLWWSAIGKIQFKSPVAIARHGSTFFVADSALKRVIAFDIKGKLQFEISRDLERPSGLAISGEKLFVADSQQHEILVFDVRGRFLSKFGRRGGGPGEFNFPTHVSADAQANIYVTDSLNCRIQVFDANGRFLRTFGAAGDGPGCFTRPKGVAVDDAGHVYVVDAVFDNVQVFDQQARLLLNWGEGGQKPGEFWLPNAIAVSKDNLIYVSDSYNHRIQVFQYLGKP